MKRLLFVTVAVIGLSGCASDKISPAEGELLGCEAYASTLNTLATLRADGKLSAGTIGVVDHVRETVNPLCLGPAPDVNASVKDIAVDAGVRTLTSIVATVF